jgi:hypothetical protein
MMNIAYVENYSKDDSTSYLATQAKLALIGRGSRSRLTTNAALLQQQQPAALLAAAQMANLPFTTIYSK